MDRLRAAAFVKANEVDGPAINPDRGYPFDGDRGTTAKAFFHPGPNSLQIPSQLIAMGDRAVGYPVDQGIRGPSSLQRNKETRQLSAPKSTATIAGVMPAASTGRSQSE